MHYHLRTFLFVAFCAGVIALWALDLRRGAPAAPSSGDGEPALFTLPVAFQEIQPDDKDAAPATSKPKTNEPSTASEQGQPEATEDKPPEGPEKKKRAKEGPKKAKKKKASTGAVSPVLATVLPKPDIEKDQRVRPKVIGQKTLLNKLTFEVSVTKTTIDGETPNIVFFLNQNVLPLDAAPSPRNAEKGTTTWRRLVTAPYPGEHQIVAAEMTPDGARGRSAPALVRIRTSGPSVQGIQPQNLSFSADHKTISVRFNAENPLDATAVDGAEKKLLKKENFILKTSHADDLLPQRVEFNPSDNSVTLSYAKEFAADNYTLTVSHENILDVFGNTMAAPFRTTLFMPVGGEVPTISRGISGSTGRNVEFSEYTPPRKILSGFNPSDRVETRVSRLYYFRDAHRVAQIINRDVKSYNRAAVDMQQQLADKARTKADEATDARRAKERKAVEAAKKTREAEREQQQAEQAAQSASTHAFQAAQPSQSGGEPRANPQQVKELEKAAAAARARAQSAREKVEALRQTEIAANEEAQAATAVEDRARDNQFRREVAAARADPDTYAPGIPESQDPVRQVSVSVIGEGLIQLRGPMKGINVIRTMINQIDAPVGQVRVSVHTVQINGEKGDRMEKVASKIQRFIDHSRFLTLQSAEMFRKAIVQVAAQKATQLHEMSGMTQVERDRKYLYAFFGQDFIHELEAMDSEFLHTGNKLLSIHSMDSTSLASAMFIMALAKNSTRMEILQTFESMMQHQLPQAEQNYFEAGYTSDGKQPLFSRDCRPEDFQLLSENARFQSIKGMFDVEIVADDTMTPFQRDFVRLAQIFKSRLIVEMELKQRVMERAVIEERLSDDPVEESRVAREKEKLARQQAEASSKQAREQLSQLFVSSQIIRGQVSALKEKTKTADTIATEFNFISIQIEKDFEQLREQAQDMKATMQTFSNDSDDPQEPADASWQAFIVAVENVEKEIPRLREELLAPACSLGEFSMIKRLLAVENRMGKIMHDADVTEPKPEFKEETNSDLVLDEGNLLVGRPVTFNFHSNGQLEITPREQRSAVRTRINEGIRAAEEIRIPLNEYNFNQLSREKLLLADQCLNRVRKHQKDDELDDLFLLSEVLRHYAELAHEVEATADRLTDNLSRILARLTSDENLENTYADWVTLNREFELKFSDSFLEASRIKVMDVGFLELIKADVNRRAAEENVESSRRPLDHKKFLDMLIDEMENKYIELLEGTRAHTANIDAYIKRLMTSLDDDFNTQFYYPTFRKVREASQMWDVQMGQVETTNVLANNRSFAKVTPEATMEFDLPKRDILITEAMNGAKAMVQDFGALAQDPTFLSMAKLGSGAPTSTQTGGANGGQSTVRNVLPGMSTDTGESVMGQQGPGGNQFGSALESLIPDPAIYKFETGTGWEIRPVIQPDGQSVVFDFNYLYTANVREPVRADEKHLGRVKRHQVSTDVQLSNFELREISRYTVALKASRTSRGVPLLEDIPVLGVMFRPQPSQESSLQQNVILGQSTIFPTLFDLMGLRWAPVVADLDPLRLSNDEFIVRSRRRALMNRVFDQSSSQVDQFLRIPEGERRMDLYRSQETIPSRHPNGYQGSGANLRDSQLREGYDTRQSPESQFIPSQSAEGSRYLPGRRENSTRGGTNPRSVEGLLLEGPLLEGPATERHGPAGAVPGGHVPEPLRPLVPRVHVRPDEGVLEEIPTPASGAASHRRPKAAPNRVAPVGYFTRMPVASSPTPTGGSAGTFRQSAGGHAEPPRPRLRRLPPVEPARFPQPDRG